MHARIEQIQAKRNDGEMGSSKGFQDSSKQWISCQTCWVISTVAKGKHGRKDQQITYYPVCCVGIFLGIVKQWPLMAKVSSC